MANRNFASGGKIYSMHVKPVQVDMQFTVTSTNGKGIVSLKGPLVQNVFMHTSTTPSAGNSNPATPGTTITNPNPIAGVALIQLQDNYNQLLAMDHTLIAPLSGSDVKIDNSAMTAGTPYTITTLGDATAAKWRAIGVPAGITAAVGVTFLAATNGGAGNTLTSRVQASVTSAVFTAELVGNVNADIAPNISAQGSGASFIVQFRDAAGALVAPTDGTVIGLKLLLSDSSVTVTNSPTSDVE